LSTDRSSNFEISFAGQSKSQFEGLVARARAKGKEGQLFAAMKAVVDQLTSGVFADLLYTLAALHLTVGVAIKPPLVVHYGGNQEERKVFLKSVVVSNAEF
jgi:hypothetical protein